MLWQIFSHENQFHWICWFSGGTRLAGVYGSNDGHGFGPVDGVWPAVRVASHHLYSTCDARRPEKSTPADRATTQWKVTAVIATGGSYAPADAVGSGLVNLDSPNGDPI